MADIEYSGEPGPQDVQPETGGSSLGFVVNVIGALTSLALVVGIGVWGYRLLVRDVSGVPVVRALEGPLRIQPEEPGGEPADYQGLAVNAVAAQGIASPPADRLMLAPRPVALTGEDTPVARREPVAVSLTRDDGAPEDSGATPERTIAALVKQLTAGVAPMAKDGKAPDPGVTQAAARIGRSDPPGSLESVTLEDDQPAEAAVVLEGPGLKRSLRPLARPARAVPSAAIATEQDDMTTAIDAAVEISATLDVDPATLPTGTRLAQLGAYDTPEIARLEWDRLYGRFGDYLDGKKRVIQEASSGGRTFYRLRAMGFDDLSDARRFCSALVAENADCIPVTTR